MSDEAASEVVIVTGVLGWGNRKGGLEAYGPGGRWRKRDDGSEVEVPNGTDGTWGDLLGDALERAGVTEGADLLVIAIPRGPDRRWRVDDAIVAVSDALGAGVTEV